MKTPRVAGKACVSFKKSLVFTAVLSGMAVCLPEVHAASITWTGANGSDMATSTNWSPNGTIAGATNALIFGASSVTNVTNTAVSATATSITFNSTASAYTITGSGLALSGAITNNSTSLETINLALALVGNSTITTTAGGGDIVIGGAISGPSNWGITKAGVGTLTLTGSNNYTGVTTVSSGTLQLTGSGSVNSTSGVTLSSGSGATLLLDDRGSTSLGQRVTSANAINLSNGTQIIYQGSDQAATNSSELIGNLNTLTGISSVTVDYNATNTATLTAASLTHKSGTGGIALFNGINLGTPASSSAAKLALTSTTGLTQLGVTASSAAGINAGTYNTKIVPFLLGESGTASAAGGTATGTANTFLTYNSTTGFRPLNPTDEFVNNSITNGTNNTYITQATTASSSAVINSLVINGGDLSIGSGNKLTNYSGALLFVTNNAIKGSGTLNLGSGTQDGIVTVNQGVSAGINSNFLLTGTNSFYGYSNSVLTLGGNISGTGSIYLNGGSYTLSGSNSYAGNTMFFTSGTVTIASNSAFSTGTLSMRSNSTLQGDGVARTISNTIYNISLSPFTIGGSSDLAFTGAVTPYQTVTITNTGLTLFSGTLAYANNNLNINLNNSANVVINGNLTGSAGLTLNMIGGGANVTISGNNTGLTGNVAATGIGYATLTLSGANPLGSGTLMLPGINNGGNCGFYLVAGTNNTTLANTISSNNTAYQTAIGFTGTNNLTLSGSVTSGGAPGILITNLASGTLSLTGAATVTTGTVANVTILGGGSTVFANTSSFGVSGSGTVGLSKAGTGVLTLSGANNLNGTNTLAGGTVVLDYSSTSAGGGSNRLSQNIATTSTASALTLSGVNLQLYGGAYNQTLGTNNGTTIGFGQSTITQQSGSSTIALGGISRLGTAVGGVVDFQSGVATTTSANTNGILGAWATVGGTSFATVSSGTIVGVDPSTLTALVSTGTNTSNSILTDGTSASGNISTNTLTVTTTQSNQLLDLNGKTLTLSGAGLLFNGANDYTISNGTLRGSSTASTDLIVQQYGSGKLTISGTIANNGTGMALTKAGNGTLVLTGSNTYSGGTYLDSGILQISGSANLGTGGINFNGGTLETTASGTTGVAVSFNANGGTIQVDSGTWTLSGSLSSSKGSNSTAGLTKTGAGTLVLSGSNGSYYGATVINEGTLKLGNANALGASLYQNSTIYFRQTSPVTVNNGILDLAGYSITIGNLTLSGGSIVDSTSGNATLGAYSTTLQSGTVAVALVDMYVGYNSNYLVSSTSSGITKNTSGTAVLVGNNAYSGATIINQGTLQIGNGGTVGQLGTGSVTDNDTLAFNRSDAITVSNAISGTGSVIQQGPGTLALAGNNSYTGATTVQSGTLAFGTLASGTSAQALGSGAVVNIGVTGSSAGTLRYTGAAGTFDKNIYALGNGLNTVQNNGSGLLTLSGSLVKDGTILVLNGGDYGINVTGVISGNSAHSDLYITGGTTTLSNVNTYSGPTQVYGGGVLVNGVANALPVSSKLILGGVDDSNGTFDLNGFSQTVAGLSSTGNGVQTVTNNAAAAATLTTTGDGTFGGVIADGSGVTALAVTGGNLVLNGANTYSGATTVTGGTLTVNGSLSGASAVSANNATLAGSGTMGSVGATDSTINGNGLKLGATVLNGSSKLNGYNIATSVTVNGGTTVLTGTTKSAAAVVVSTGATLENRGVVDSSVSVNSGLLEGNGSITGDLSLTHGTFTPDGIATIGGNFTLDADSTLKLAINGAVAGSSYSQVKVSGNIALAGTLDLSVLNGLVSPGSSITLIDNIGSGSTTSGYFTEIITSGSTYYITGSSSTYTILASGTQYVLNYAANADGDSTYNDVTLTVVPEPQTWASVIAGASLLAFTQMIRRRRQ